MVGPNIGSLAGKGPRESPGDRADRGRGGLQLREVPESGRAGRNCLQTAILGSSNEMTTTTAPNHFQECSDSTTRRSCGRERRSRSIANAAMRRSERIEFFASFEQEELSGQEIAEEDVSQEPFAQQDRISVSQRVKKGYKFKRDGQEKVSLVPALASDREEDKKRAKFVFLCHLVKRDGDQKNKETEKKAKEEEIARNTAAVKTLDDGYSSVEPKTEFDFLHVDSCIFSNTPNIGPVGQT
ncbi:hypothetical protein L596_000205 [Steinernema carpocapsae]|uniref:Uncharacterized protein n=1 Tax=Steinernema carpocapsae TaxID=34508 RepID=A0A4V6I721_STECR|nr:hypothetical protein L596_000205 [Steinernema carpocapsae]